MAGEKKTPKADPLPELGSAPTWGPPLPEFDDEKEYVAIEDLDEETAAEVRAAVRSDPEAGVSELPEDAKISPGGKEKPSGEEVKR